MYATAMDKLGGSGNCSIGPFTKQFLLFYSQQWAIGNIRHKFRCSGTRTNLDKVYHREYNQMVRHILALLEFWEFREGRLIPTCLENPYVIFLSGKLLPANHEVACAATYARPRGVSSEYHQEKEEGYITPKYLDETASPEVVSEDSSKASIEEIMESDVPARRGSTDSEMVKAFCQGMGASGSTRPPDVKPKQPARSHETVKVSVSRKGTERSDAGKQFKY